MPEPTIIRNKLYGLIFDYGFEEISRAYQMSINVQINRKTDAEAVVRKRYRMKPDEPIPEVEYGEDGEPSNDFMEEVGELEQEADSTAQTIRAAFLIGLFHFWERHSNRWVGRQAYNRRKVVAWLRNQGCSPNDALLKDLELAANCAKHGPGKSANQLFARRPDLFQRPEVNHPLVPFEPSDQSLKINSETLRVFFDAVEKSGPRIKNP
jgi:hypothetical protein